MRAVGTTNHNVHFIPSPSAFSADTVTFPAILQSPYSVTVASAAATGTAGFRGKGSGASDTSPSRLGGSSND